MTTARPPEMPSRLDRCWGKLIQDGDRECEQCRWNDSCRSRFMEVAVATPVRPPPQPLPVYNTAPLPITPMPAAMPTGVVPMPPPRVVTAPPPVYRPYQPPTQATAQVRYPTTPSVPQPVSTPQSYQHHPQYPYQHSQQGYSIPDPNRPNPMDPMFRPGAQGPTYYFNQYPEESTANRLMKNMFLRAMEALFSELSSFFRHWTMPPR